jgi:dUTP pyrophosphatase
MILPGRVLIPKKIISKVRSAIIQPQPCGIDLTLKRILTWTSAGVVDFDNSKRKNAETREIIFESATDAAKLSADFVNLGPGSFLVEFNEFVDTPLDVMGQVFVRSSLFRSGALMSAGVMDCGYKGAMGALLQVVNPNGLGLYKNARLAQMVFHEMSEPVEGYNGTYQGRENM